MSSLSFYQQEAQGPSLGPDFGGAKVGFCAPTALQIPPGSLPARSPSQLRTAARGQGGVGAVGLWSL